MRGWVCEKVTRVGNPGSLPYGEKGAWSSPRPSTNRRCHASCIDVATVEAAAAIVEAAGEVAHLARHVERRTEHACECPVRSKLDLRRSARGDGAESDNRTAGHIADLHVRAHTARDRVAIAEPAEEVVTERCQPRDAMDAVANVTRDGPDRGDIERRTYDPEAIEVVLVTLERETERRCAER